MRPSATARDRARRWAGSIFLMAAFLSSRSASMAGRAIAHTNRVGGSLLLLLDRDAYQLVNDNVLVVRPRMRVRDRMRIGPAEDVERIGVLPKQVTDFKAIAGHATYGITGAK